MGVSWLGNVRHRKDYCTVYSPEITLQKSRERINPSSILWMFGLISEWVRDDGLVNKSTSLNFTTHASAAIESTARELNQPDQKMMIFASSSICVAKGV